MKIRHVCLAIALFCSLISFGQSQLFYESFETGGGTFTLNGVGPGTNSGTNEWIVNNTYTGGGIYPNTINEDSTYGGTIAYAPFGHYLHIYDVPSTHTNDNYNPANASDRFAYLTNGICTKHLKSINLNFFYLCQGSGTAYGQVYYSINGGAWTQTGSAQYNNKHKWQYTTITDPAFSNVDNLRFGFRWQNNAGSGKDTSAFGIDDMSIFGTYDSVPNPIKCTWTNLGVDSCLGNNDYVFLQYQLSDTLCDAIWDMEMSDGNGNFPGPYTWYQTIGRSYSNDIIGYWYLTFPPNFSTVGGCYKFKMVRTTYPYLSFEDSVCFPFDTCGGSVTAHQPVVTMDTNPVCAGSVIDVPFNSSGTYTISNVYYAELIDSIGNSAIIDTLGSLVSNLAYPSTPTGSVPGMIPLTVPAGCKYYVRVISTTGGRIPSMWGPFCIQHCDILSNSQQSIQACLGRCSKDPNGFSDTLNYTIHQFDNRSKYSSANKFKVQLLSFTNLTAVNTGGLGLIIDTLSGKIRLHVPCDDSLNIMGIPPGVYYIRVIATNSNFPDSSLGSLVHLTIGEPADSLFLTVLPAGSTFCLGSTVTFYTNPDHEYSPYYSTYTWWLGQNNVTQPFAGWSGGTLALYATTAGEFQITVQENSYGCLGPKVSMPDSMYIMGHAKVNITIPSTACLGDTILASVPYVPYCIYNWHVYGKSTMIPSGNKVKIVFDSLGTFKVSLQGLDSCFEDSAYKMVHVTVCAGIQNINNTLNVSVYPNPSNGRFNFNFTGVITEGLKLEVYNMMGQVVKTEEVTSSSRILDLSENPNGIYYYRVIENDGSELKSGKLIIGH